MVNTAAQPAPHDAVQPLGKVRASDVARVGAKAATLGELMAAGLPVPDGFALTIDAFTRFLTHNGLGRNSSPEEVLRATIPHAVRLAVSAAMRALGDEPLAVRSSAMAEDRADASFAGQYESFLDVRGEEAVIDAIRRCWAAIFSERVATYQGHRARSDPFGMGILVQRMVPAKVAGVAFSANPVTGARNETLVSAVHGLGERLVSGTTSPDEWVVSAGEAIRRAAPEDAIDAEQAIAVARLARRVAEHLGSPQDIEWAIADGAIYLLQARPITALPDAPPEPVPVPVEPPPGFWQREPSHFPNPLSPMTASVLLPIQNASGKRVFDAFSLLVENLETREIGGWVYNRLVPLGGKDRPTPPGWMMPLLIRVVPQMRQRIRGATDAMRSDLAGRLIERWYEEWRPELTGRIAQLRDLDLRSLPDNALEHHLDQVHALLKDGTDIHFMLHAPGVFALASLAFFCRDVLDWDDAQTLDLLVGLSSMSTEPARRLADLAATARERPAVRALLERVDKDTAGRLSEIDPEFAQEFAAYERVYGCRALNYDLAEPSMAEAPGLLLGLLADQVAQPHDTADRGALDEHREAVTAAARVALAGRSAPEREEFERVLVRARRAYPVREDNEFYTLSAPLALMRHTLREVGARLTERGQLNQADDIFFLRYDEARTALHDRAERTAPVARRRGERAWVLAHPGPATYGRAPAGPPSIAALPPEPRFQMRAMLWFAGHATGAGAAAGAGAATELHGIPASAGAYTGPARVVMNESEFGRLQAGDVLVCPITSPVWSVLFPSIGALVTDTGGMLSHAAIIAREYRVPAVVATGDATRRLRDNYRIAVDGTAGIVRPA